MSEPLLTTTKLRKGDVVVIAVQLTDKQTGQLYWWHRFAAVVGLPSHHNQRHFAALTLKLNPTDKDTRIVNMTDEKQVVTLIDPTRYPPGVKAIYMKLLATGHIELGE